ncbi:flagellar protein FliO/FliZ [Geodermatophilus africanus]|jgi:flagellar protein FliO/FliZ|uniref:Flagellar protein FliO/FliZ n=1 Tax=Geodermatophilus africanus TaxID=1137993 RepID=A0A1H3FUK5_9ACTN|nr:flagellar biosynthetic protein FliO [Geodermatophilus africanus]SDX94783.1 flagellar protein FliO/FliZ [Geodermatophilus africanus]
MTWMVVRLVLSLAFIALVLWFAARVAQKRGLGQGNGLIEVVARQRMGRASSVSVVRIAGRVLVVGSTEEQVTLLAEVDGEVVEEAIAERRPATAQPAVAGAPGVLAGSVFDRNGWTSFVSSLRERTVRR